MSSHTAILATVISSGMLAACSGTREPQPLPLQFDTFTAAGMVEQDVFVEDQSDAMLVKRVALVDVVGFSDTPLFGATEEPPFEPMREAPIETYGKGAVLDITLQDWLAATGTGTYRCEEDRATVTAHFENLVPDGVYTMWNFIDLDPPSDPYKSMAFPLGPRDGSEAKFVADSEGNATYLVIVEPCLEMGGSQTLTGLAIAWHSDGETYGFSPGGLGVDSHVQLQTAFPKN